GNARRRASARPWWRTPSLRRRSAAVTRSSSIVSSTWCRSTTASASASSTSACAATAHKPEARAKEEHSPLARASGLCTHSCMRVAHFVQRYPPALGGSEVSFARLGRYLAAAGDDVTVFTTTAVDLEAFWKSSGRCLPAGVCREDGVEVRRYPLCR